MTWEIPVEVTLWMERPLNPSGHGIEKLENCYRIDDKFEFLCLMSKAWDRMHGKYQRL